MKTVLVVDDDPVSLKLLANHVKKLNLSPLIASSGDEAWGILCDSSPEELQNLCAVFSDIVMPDGEGISLLENIRGHESISDIPVFLISGTEDKMLMDDAKRFFVNGFLQKPLTLEQIKSHLESCN